MTELPNLLEHLRLGLAASRQGTYRRRLPAPRARQDLEAARTGLRKLVVEKATPEAWRALALAEEAFLDYSAAIQALETAIAASAKSHRKDVKRLHQLRETAARWQSLALNPQQLQTLGDYLEEHLAVLPCDHTLHHTRAWLLSQPALSLPDVLRGLEQAGGFCDCEVVLNVV